MGAVVIRPTGNRNGRTGSSRRAPRLHTVVAIGCLLASAPSVAASPFDGDWLADLDTETGLATDVYLVSGGHYACTSCTPPRAYPADGRPHPVPGDADVTSEAVRIAGPRRIVTHIIGPPLDRTTTMTVSADDRTATYVSIDRRPGIGVALRTEYLARRTAPTPAGAHLVSGSWQGVRYVAVPALVRTTTLRLVGDAFSFSTPLGVSFTARLGGSEVPVRSANARGVTVAVRQSGPRRIDQTVSRDGKPVELRSFTVNAAGDALEIATTDPATGTTYRGISRRVLRARG